MKRIAVIVSNDIATDQRMERICTSLAESGYNVEIVGRNQRTSINLISKPYKQTRLDLWFKHGVLFYLELNLRLIFRLLFTRVDIVYAVDADTLIAGSILKLFKNIKLVFDAHELFSEVPELEGRKLKKKVWQLVEKFGIQWFTDARITVSGSVAIYYTGLYGKNFTVVKNCPYSSKNKAGETSEKFILYQGALNEGRGLETLILAAKSLDLNIKIAGTGDLDEKLRKLVLQNGLEQKVVFLGKLLPESLKEITGTAWLGYNLLEKKGLSYFYSLSNKTFDYMQAGVPQLISPFPEYQAINEIYPYALELDLQVNSIVTAISKLKEDIVLYQKLKQGALDASVVYCWENEREILRKVILSL